MSLLFAPGARPRAAAIVALSEANGRFAISFDPAAEGFGDERVADAAALSHGGSGSSHWLELLANGLTFDLAGLDPGEPADPPPHGHSFGLPANLENERLEAITLQPGPHLAGGATMLPVIRSLAWLAALLTALPGAKAVAWHPARCWSPPAQFRDLVLRWIDGGVFPGFGLAALAPMPDGGMQSEGLALFTGQELRLEPELAEDRAAAARIGLRLLHWMIEHGRVDAAERLNGPEGQPLRLEPSANGRFVRVWKA